MQGILMDLALKFLPQEGINDQRAFDVTTVLQLQIQEKDNELKDLLDHCTKVEQENTRLMEKNKKFKDKYATLKKEYAQCKADLSDSEKNTSSVNSYDLDMQLEKENEALKNEVKSLAQELLEMRHLNESIAKAENELMEAEQRAKKAQEIIEQQRKKLSSLTVENSKLKKNIEILYDVADKVKGLQKEKSRIEFTNKMANEQLELQSKIIDELQESNKKTLAEKERYAKLLKFSEQNERFWKQKVAQKMTESPDEKVKQEGHKWQGETNQYRISESFEFEAKEGYYRNEIETLQRKITEITNANTKYVNSSIIELNKQLDILREENDKLNKQLKDEYSMRAELEKVNEELQSEVESFGSEKSTFAETMKELQRTRKDREVLLEISERAQSTLKEVDTAKLKITKLTTKNEELEKLVDELRNSKEEAESLFKKENEEKLRLGVKLAGSEEKVKFLKEEIKKAKVSLTGPEDIANLNLSQQVVWFSLD